MATYKAEFLHHHYARRLRPRAHYSMGWLPVSARLAALAPSVVNAVTQSPVLRTVVKAAGGIAPERELPLFADQRFPRWFGQRDPEGDGRRGQVLLWPDTFTEFFHPHVGQAAVQVLEDAGFRVRLPEQELCCGLTWIFTGQLSVAARVLRPTAAALRPALDEGLLVVGLEPSCTAVFRADAPELLPDDEDVQQLARSRLPSCSPTASAAARRSSRATPGGAPSTSPRRSPDSSATSTSTPAPSSRSAPARDHRGGPRRRRRWPWRPGCSRQPSRGRWRRSGASSPEPGRREPAHPVTADRHQIVEAVACSWRTRGDANQDANRRERKVA
jgi:hypothetical protein